MDRRTAKELLHVEGWLARAAEIVARGKAAYLSDAMLQEAGDSLMMKRGAEPTCTPRRPAKLSRDGSPAPPTERRSLRGGPRGLSV